jgi:hypothetical protein
VDGPVPVIRLLTNGVIRWGWLGDYPSAGQSTFWNYTNGKPLITMNSAGRVGIGTTAPSNTLTVGGTIESITGGFKFPDASIQTTALPAGCALNQFPKWSGTAWTCAAGSGSGTVTSIAAGAGLTGGTITTSGTLAIDTTQVPLLGAANTFSNSQTINGSLTVTGAQGILLDNDTSTGTVLNQPVKLTLAGKAAASTTGDSSGAIGIAALNAGTSGKVTVAAFGVATCQFDNQSAAGDYVTIGASGLCHDIGASYPGLVQVLGRAVSANSGASTPAQMYLFGTESHGFASKKDLVSGLSFTNWQNGTVAPSQSSGQISPSGGGPGGPFGWAQYDPPDGSTITGLTICGTINSGAVVGDYFAVRLKRKSLTNSALAPDTLGTATTDPNTLPGTLPANLCQSAASITNGAVDKANFTYYLELQMDGGVQVTSVQVAH